MAARTLSVQNARRPVRIFFLLVRLIFPCPQFFIVFYNKGSRKRRGPRDFFAGSASNRQTLKRRFAAMAARTLSVQNARRPVYHAAPCSKGAARVISLRVLRLIGKR